MNRDRLLALLFFATAALTTSCNEAQGESRIGATTAAPTAGPTAPPLRPVAEGPIEEAIWYSHAGQQSAAALWLSPPLRDASGLFIRWWTLSCTLPGSGEPLSCLQGAVKLDGTEPILLKGGLFSFGAVPRGERLWRDVRSKEDLDVGLEGFF